MESATESIPPIKARVKRWCKRPPVPTVMSGAW